MALKKEFNGKSIYVRVDRVICGKTVQIPDLIVGIYEEIQLNDVVELKQQTKMHFYFNTDDPNFNRFTPEELSKEGINPIKAAYQFLKDLPQFSDFEDC